MLIGLPQQYQPQYFQAPPDPRQQYPAGSYVQIYAHPQQQNGPASQMAPHQVWFQQHPQAPQPQAAAPV